MSSNAVDILLIFILIALLTILLHLQKIDDQEIDGVARYIDYFTLL